MQVKFLFCFFTSEMQKNNRQINLTLGRTRGARVARGGGGGGCHFPSEVFLSFLLDDKTSSPDVFNTCSIIPRTHFETILVMVSYYSYEI